MWHWALGCYWTHCRIGGHLYAVIGNRTYKLMVLFPILKLYPCNSMVDSGVFSSSNNSFTVMWSLYTNAKPPPMHPDGLGVDRILYPIGGISLVMVSMSSCFIQVSVIAHASISLSSTSIWNWSTLLPIDLALTCDRWKNLWISAVGGICFNSVKFGICSFTCLNNLSVTHWCTL